MSRLAACALAMVAAAAIPPQGNALRHINSNGLGMPHGTAERRSWSRSCTAPRLADMSCSEVVALRGGKPEGPLEREGGAYGKSADDVVARAERVMLAAKAHMVSTDATSHAGEPSSYADQTRAHVCFPPHTMLALPMSDGCENLHCVLSQLGLQKSRSSSNASHTVDQLNLIPGVLTSSDCAPHHSCR